MILNNIFLMAIDKGKSKAMFNLGDNYKNIEKNNNESIKYYLMAIQKNYQPSKHSLKDITNSLERYFLYKQYNIIFDEEVTKDIHIFNNKLKISKNDLCGICLEENKQCILLNCFFHYVCINCYIQLYDKPCSFCRL